MKPIIQKTIEKPFDLRDGRAMVSLGPLSGKKYCTYSCPFCYVHSDFLSYATLTIESILDWLNNNKNYFNIIYISGDTDSFAPPRTSLGLELLEMVTQFGVDVLFTTRAVFNANELKRLENIKTNIERNGKKLFGCVSIAQINHNYLEPKPIPSVDERINQLEIFKNIGIISILAMRPFLPVVPIEDYLKLIEKVNNKVFAILGEVWYTDTLGILEKGVFQGKTVNNLTYHPHEMDFDDNVAIWKVWKGENIQIEVSKKCSELNIPFFMRSKPALDWINNNIKI